MVKRGKKHMEMDKIQCRHVEQSDGLGAPRSREFALPKIKGGREKIQERRIHQQLQLTSEAQSTLGVYPSTRCWRAGHATASSGISRRGRAFYRNKQEITRVLGGLGLAIVSTSKGCDGRPDAQRNGVGGEVLCNLVRKRDMSFGKKIPRERASRQAGTASRLIRTKVLCGAAGRRDAGRFRATSFISRAGERRRTRASTVWFRALVRETMGGVTEGAEELDTSGSGNRAEVKGKGSGFQSGISSGAVQHYERNEINVDAKSGTSSHGYDKQESRATPRDSAAPRAGA